jgi:uncharacterized protein (TIGR02231 family)
VADLIAQAVATSVRRITFFEDRAEVVRVLSVHLPAGRARLHAEGVTLLVDDRSVGCKSAEELAVVFSRVRRRAYEVTAASTEEVAALEAAFEAARDEQTRLGTAIEREERRGHRADEMFTRWAETVGHVPSRGDAAAIELGAAYDVLEREGQEALVALTKLRAARRNADDEVSRAHLRLTQARMKKPRYDAFVEIEVVAAKEGDYEIELTYRTPCALWRPEHLARLVQRDGKAEMTLTTYATVWQRTGETWGDVPCRFSTARPANSATAPLLAEDVLQTRKKTDTERRQIVVDARDEAVELAGSDRGTRDVDEMPGVDDGGQAQWLDAENPATIESDGLPVRIEIGSRTLACEVERVCFPEKSPATHVRARATLTGGPLLAGPVVVARETELVGRSTVGFVGAGEPFELGFGIDDGVRVQRKQTETRKTTPVIGTQHISREVRLYVSNPSDTERSVAIVERIPVSEVEDIVVRLEPGAQQKLDTKNGFVTITQDVPPAATRDLLITYAIEAKSNVVLPA